MRHVILNSLFMILSFTVLAQEKARIVPVEQANQEKKVQRKLMKKNSESFQVNYSNIWESGGDNQLRVVEVRKHADAIFTQMAGMVIDTFFDQGIYHVQEVDSFSVSSAEFTYSYEHHGRQDSLFFTFRNATTGDYSVSSEVLDKYTLLIDSTTFSAGANEYRTVKRAAVEFTNEPTFSEGAIALTIGFSGTDGSRFGAAFSFEDKGSCPEAEIFTDVSSDGSYFYPRSFYKHEGSIIPYEQDPRFRDCNGNGEYDPEANEETLLQNLAVELRGTLYPKNNTSSQSQKTIQTNQFKLFPNPAENRLTWPQDVQVQELAIMNLQGQKVATFQKPEDAVRLEIPAGTYMAEVKTQDQQVYQVRFVKN